MSINLNLCSPNKHELAEIIQRIADLIETSTNETVSINLAVHFNERAEKGKK